MMNEIKLLIRRSLTPAESLSQRVMQSGFWVFALRIVERLFGLVRTVVLARLLAPKDFGLFGLALLALSVLETISETGFNAALIQKKEDVCSYLDTAWTVQVIRGLILGGLLIAIAPRAAIFFGEPTIVPFIQALALYQVFHGLVNIGVIYFRKDLEFQKEFLYTLGGALVDIVTVITSAIIMRSAWALVLGLIAGRFAKMILSYLVHPYRPRLRLEIAKAKELHAFGRWIYGANIAVFLATHGDDIIVGRILGASALGLYQLAFRFSNLMATEVSDVVAQVSFPAYSAVQDSRARLGRGFIRTLQGVLALSVPIAVLFLLLAEEFIRIFLGPSWLAAVLPMRILAVEGFLRSVAGTGGPLFRGVGRPYLSFWLVFARVLVTFALIWPFLRCWSLSGAAMAVLSGFILSIPIWVWASIKVTGFTIGKIGSAFLPSLGAGAVMAGLVVVVRRLVGPLNLPGLLGLCAFVLSFYLFVLLLLSKISNRSFIIN